MADAQIRNKSYGAGREIKASAHYSYIVNGLTLDGTKFAAGELVLEGQCLVRDTTTGKYEKYTEAVAGTFPAGKDNPMVLDESVQFVLKDGGGNPDVIVGQVMVHGSVYKAMCPGYTDAFAAKVPQIRFI